MGDAAYATLPGGRTEEGVNESSLHWLSAGSVYIVAGQRRPGGLRHFPHDSECEASLVYTNTSMPSYSPGQRRVPQQERGERRVAGLLEAAEAVIADIGYEAATMSAIAERAGAAIGSLYQFFPNKASITQALRTEYARQFDNLYAPFAAKAKTLKTEALVSELIDRTIHFVETHPALPALLDAPRNTRAPAPMRNALRKRFAAVLLAQNPRLSEAKALRLGTVVLHIIKALNQLYTESPRDERQWMIQEFKVVLLLYFGERLAPRTNGRVRK